MFELIEKMLTENGKMFEFQVIDQLITKHGFVVPNKFFHRRTSSWFQFETEVRADLEILGIVFSTEKYQDEPDSYYSYRDIMSLS